jgi:hypothetical protein
MNRVSLTIKVPLILKVREIIFFAGILKKCSIMCFEKNNFPHFQNQRCIGIFMSQRERERGRESEMAERQRQR